MSQASRDQTLARLRNALPESAPLPDLPPTGPWQTFSDPFQQFCDVLETVGGRCIRVPNLAAADERLNQIPEWKDATVRLSVVEGVGDSTIAAESIDDPHDLEHVDFAVLHGHFAVAENGAIWVTDETLKHRVLYFLPQRLALVISAHEIVNNMHEAYARLDVGRHTFACFISGPSKTADIEQSLVIGAHGARALTVLAVDSPGGP